MQINVHEGELMDITKIQPDEVNCFIEGDYSVYELTSTIASAPAIFNELIQHYFTYPFYITFEGYDDVRSAILTDDTIEWISDIGSVLTMQGNAVYHKGVPSFRATINSANDLMHFLRHNYRYAVENNFFAATQYKYVTYKPVIQDRRTQSFAYLHACMHPHFVMFGENAQSVIIGTSTERTEEALYDKLQIALK